MSGFSRRPSGLAVEVAKMRGDDFKQMPTLRHFPQEIWDSYHVAHLSRPGGNRFW